MGPENPAPPGFEPRTPKSATSRYTDYAIPAPVHLSIFTKYPSRKKKVAVSSAKASRVSSTVSKNKVSDGQKENTNALSYKLEEPGQYWHSNGNKPQQMTVAVGLSQWNVKSSPYRTTQLLKPPQNKM
jgi:hypothetical protein